MLRPLGCQAYPVKLKIGRLHKLPDHDQVGNLGIPAKITASGVILSPLLKSSGCQLYPVY